MSDSQKLVLATGILITATHPELGDCVLLRRRGGFNPESVTKPGKWGRQSFAGGCQPLAHGKHSDYEANSGRGRQLALLREVKEELGNEWSSHVAFWLLARTADVIHKYIEGGQSV